MKNSEEISYWKTPCYICVGLYIAHWVVKLLIIAGLFIASQAGAAETTIGNAHIVVKTVTGIINEEVRQINMMDDVYHNELIETGPESATEFVFLDGTKLAMGPNSSMILDSFVYDPETHAGTFVITAIGGAFRFVSGKMDKASYEIHTPTATIGIRG